MSLAAANILGAILIFVLSASTFAPAQCPVDEVIVRGRVDHPPGNATVRVQLVYARNMPGESGDTTLENENFSLPLEFLTESRRPIINGSFGKCGRRPTTVIVTLADREQNHEYDRISLDFAKDFKMLFSGTYALKSELLLKGPQ